jgi:hypothetical protein
LDSIAVVIARQDGFLRHVEQHLLEPVLTGDISKVDKRYE